jgi:hypothetical protein
VGNSDLGELAARMCAGLEGVRACLLLSPDGLTLGAYPSGGEDQGRSAWDKLEAMGSPVRGFVDLGEEVWVIARRGPYTAVLVSAPTIRPGLLLDRVEALLRAAEETRVQTAAAAPPQPVRRPRTSLHRETAKREAEETADREDAPKPTPGKGRTPEPARAASKEAASDSRQKPAAGSKEDATSDEPRYAPPDELASAARNVIDVSELEGEAGASAGDEAGRAPAPTPTPANGHGRSDIDRVALAREFGRLIADSESQEDR